MKCRNCGVQIRENTIICPVCSQQQNLTLHERLMERIKELLAAKSVQKRSPLF
ncbi:MAG: hypothetical protein V1794_03645 [Candidatus Glassbacteria bacterium]